MHLINENMNVLMIGLGLIGGSYAKGLSQKGICVRAIDCDPAALSYAKEREWIEEGYVDVCDEALDWADLIVFALYPTTFIAWIEEHASRLHAGTILTDVTGVKGVVVERIQSMLPQEVEFIAAHPMAGRERSGVQNSDEKIFYGANYIVVPTEKNTERAIACCKQLGRLLGFARVSVLSVEKHDEMIAFLSQLTHCIAVSLMTCNDNADLAAYTGDSFRDLTRIARINDNMWSELFLMNREALLTQMDCFMEEFASMRKLLEQGNREGLREKMRLSTERRAKFDRP